MKVIEEPGARPILLWTDDVEPEALRQLRNTARLPIIDPHGVAAMPDVHYGIGATVGSVIATQRAIVPAAVGVDIGCFGADTKVPLLDGTQARMVDLAQEREPFWVYSIDTKLGVVPGLARCVKTRENAQ